MSLGKKTCPSTFEMRSSTPGDPVASLLTESLVLNESGKYSVVVELLFILFYIFFIFTYSNVFEMIYTYIFFHSRQSF